MPRYYIDLGSSTIKVYEYNENLTLIEEHSIYFKNDFDSVKGLSKTNLDELLEFFTKLKKTYNLQYENTHIYVTGIFRNLIYDKKIELIKLFNDQFDLYFNIISHGLENYYLTKAMNNNYNNKKVLIINMGGKTTELVTVDKGLITDTKNLTLGVADILNNFSRINETYSHHSIEDIESFVSDKLSNVKLNYDYDCAIFTGGEEYLNYLLILTMYLILYLMMVSINI